MNMKQVGLQAGDADCLFLSLTLSFITEPEGRLHSKHQADAEPRQAPDPARVRVRGGTPEGELRV